MLKTGNVMLDVFSLVLVLARAGCLSARGWLIWYSILPYPRCACVSAFDVTANVHVAVAMQALYEEKKISQFLTSIG